MKNFYTPNEAAAILPVHINTIYALIQSRTLEATKFGGQWRIHKDALAALKATFVQFYEDGECVGVPDAADNLGIHFNTVYKMLRDGTLPGTKIHGQWRIPKMFLHRSVEIKASDPTSLLYGAAVNVANVMKIVMEHDKPFVIADQSEKKALCINEGCLELSGRAESWFRKNDYMSIIHPDYQEKYLDSERELRRLYLEDPTKFPLEIEDRMKIVDLNGRKKWVGYKAVVIFIGDRLLSTNVCWLD